MQQVHCSLLPLAANLLSGLVLADCHQNPVMPCGNNFLVGKQGDLIFDCGLFCDPPLREAGQINPVLLFVLAVSP